MTTCMSLIIFSGPKLRVEYLSDWDHGFFPENILKNFNEVLKDCFLRTCLICSWCLVDISECFGFILSTEPDPLCGNGSGKVE